MIKIRTWYRRSRTKGENGEKTITTPTTKNPLTGERVGKGEPTEETTKDPVDEIIHYGGEKYHKDIKMNLIQTHRR